MRIQHNIMAMNSYRNYTNNVSAMKKNLEKLSSGYKINRAGDDAAGLAISEKMRAQITGLKQAQNNAKSGINLVQTAEGALQEVHDMLNRMVKLADQSANGTYDNETDRDQLQKEVEQLKSEVNRIADSANFNGIKLLDGSLAGGSGAAGTDAALSVSGKFGTVSQGTPVALETTVTFTAPGATTAGDVVTVDLELADGTKKSFEFISDGSKYSYNGEDASSAVDAAGLSAAVAYALGKDSNFTDQYSIDGSAAAFKLTAKDASFKDPAIKVATVKKNGTLVGNIGGAISTNKEGKGAYSTVDVANMTVYDASSTTRNVKDSVITVNGQQFAFAKDEASAKELGAGVNVVFTGDTTAPDNDDAVAMVQLMNQKLGANITQPSSGTSIDMISKGGFDSGAGGGLVLQIGDTSDSFNQLTVSIRDMHVASLGISSVDISTQTGAQAAVDVIKAAINKVSDVRGTLGATQNRLDHTINNLSVMEENIQDAESTIRDTDVADEMMAYTKNNILIQSAQAMLAQANQVPQGVLQLLQ